MSDMVFPPLDLETAEAQKNSFPTQFVQHAPQIAVGIIITLILIVIVRHLWFKMRKVSREKKFRIGVVVSILWFLSGCLWSINNSYDLFNEKIILGEFITKLMLTSIVPLVFIWGVAWIRGVRD